MKQVIKHKDVGLLNIIKRTGPVIQKIDKRHCQ